MGTTLLRNYVGGTHLETHKLTKKEYDELHAIVASKKASKEILESVRAQLASAIIKEDKWWKKIAKKYNLDVNNDIHSIDHLNQALVAVPNPKAKPVQEVKQQQEEIKVRPRPPEMTGLISQDELEAMKKLRGEN